MELEKILKIINDLSVTTLPVNHWEGTSYKPYYVKLIDKDKLIKLLKTLSLNEEEKEETTLE